MLSSRARSASCVTDNGSHVANGHTSTVSGVVVGALDNGDDGATRPCQLWAPTGSVRTMGICDNDDEHDDNNNVAGPTYHTSASARQCV